MTLSMPRRHVCEDNLCKAAGAAISPGGVTADAGTDIKIVPSAEAEDPEQTLEPCADDCKVRGIGCGSGILQSGHDASLLIMMQPLARNIVVTQR